MLLKASPIHVKSDKIIGLRFRKTQPNFNKKNILYHSIVFRKQRNGK